jgi:hypothetical protein
MNISSFFIAIVGVWSLPARHATVRRPADLSIIYLRQICIDRVPTHRSCQMFKIRRLNKGVRTFNHNPVIIHPGSQPVISCKPFGVDVLIGIDRHLRRYKTVGTTAAVENGERRYYLPFRLVIIMPPVN